MKAKELVGRYQFNGNKLLSTSGGGVVVTNDKKKESAIECALICVDEMLAFDLRFFDIEFLK